MRRQRVPPGTLSPTQSFLDVEMVFKAEPFGAPDLQFPSSTWNVTLPIESMSDNQDRGVRETWAAPGRSCSSLAMIAVSRWREQLLRM